MVSSGTMGDCMYRSSPADSSCATGAVEAAPVAVIGMASVKFAFGNSQSAEAFSA